MMIFSTHLVGDQWMRNNPICTMVAKPEGQGFAEQPEGKCDLECGKVPKTKVVFEAVPGGDVEILWDLHNETMGFSLHGTR